MSSKLTYNEETLLRTLAREVARLCGPTERRQIFELLHALDDDRRVEVKHEDFLSGLGAE